MSPCYESAELTMILSRKLLCLAYGGIALIALIGTWGNNIHYLDLGLIGANIHFWQETFVNPASRSVTVDILWLALAANIWMVLEARRLAIPGVWLYILAGALIAISAAFPAFLIHRERALAAKDVANSGGTMKLADVLGLAVLTLTMLAYTVFALRM